MALLLLRRLALAAVSLVVLVALCLALLRAVPGGPFDQERLAPPEVQAALAARYALDRSYPEHLWHTLSGLLRGDLGPSFQQSDFTVEQLIGQALPLSLKLAGWAMGLAILLAVLSSQHAARSPGPPRLAWGSLATLLQATPKFVLGPVLILWLAVAWQVLPVAGYGMGWQGQVLPVLTLALPQWAWLHRVCLSEWQQVRRTPGWQAQRALGRPASVLWWGYGLRLLWAPLCRWCQPVLIALCSGSAVVEQLYGIPGLGRLLVQGAINRDYTVVLGVVCVTGLLVLLIGWLVDALVLLLDPRQRVEPRAAV